MCLEVDSFNEGAYLPFVSAPPLPEKLWHDAQLARNSSPPSASSSGVRPEVSYCSGAGIAGPGANDATKAANCAVSSSV